MRHALYIARPKDPLLDKDVYRKEALVVHPPDCSSLPPLHQVFLKNHLKVSLIKGEILGL